VGFEQIKCAQKAKAKWKEISSLGVLKIGLKIADFIVMYCPSTSLE
jgi:hypothetical protein